MGVQNIDYVAPFHTIHSIYKNQSSCFGKYLQLSICSLCKFHTIFVSSNSWLQNISWLFTKFYTNLSQFPWKVSKMLWNIHVHSSSNFNKFNWKLKWNHWPLIFWHFLRHAQASLLQFNRPCLFLLLVMSIYI